MSQKFNSPLSLTATLFTSLMLLGTVGEAIARPVQLQTLPAQPVETVQPAQVQIGNPTRLQTPIQPEEPVQPVQVQFDSPLELQAPYSIVGNWSGLMHSAGDDVGAYLELNISAGGATATWQHMGSEYVDEEWVDAVLADGTLTKTVQGDQVTLLLHGYYGKTLELQGSFQDNGQRITGQVVGETLVFGLNRM